MSVQIFRKVTVVTVAALTLFTASTAYASIDMFLAFKDSQIPGESKDIDHKDEIEVLAWSWGLQSQAGQGNKGTQVCVQDFSFTKFVDIATPALIMKGVMGQNLGRAVLVVRKAGQNPLEYIVLTMHNVTLTSVSTGGKGGEDRLTENVTLHFDRITGEYVMQKLDGSAGSRTPFEVQGIKCQ